ncbi:MAG TPA: Gfo/Idh/MocA family oxidoreductase [Verrucomicrobiae bacterium]
MKNQTRRNFLKTSLFAGATIAWTAKSWAQVPGANSSIRVATVGFRGRGKDHIGGMLKLAPEGVKYVALCDVDQKVLDSGKDAFAKMKEPLTVDTYTDMRKMYDRKDIDVVTIATPNHWHALAAIWAIQAGKDVYVEKPVSHNVWEGRKIVEAARKYNKIVQTGTQSRSSHAIKETIAWVKAGNLGKMKVARGLCYKPRASIGDTEGAQTVPETVNYDIWCGPAPLTPPMRNSKTYGPIHYEWHWFWAYGNGDLGNQGIHQMDIARWFLGVDHLSPKVFSVGGRLGYKDDAETPNTQIVYHDYEGTPLIFEVRGLPQKTGAKEMDKYKGGSVAVIIECEGGHVTVPNYTSATAVDKDGKTIKEWKGATDHYDNFIQCVKSRKASDLHADIWEGHLSSALCHTGNISYRLGKKSSPDEIKETIKGSPDAVPTFERMAEHLAANGVDIKADNLTVGPVLTMDPKTEKFVGNAEADKMLTREYRAPYVVPERV